MRIRIGYELKYQFPQPTPVIMMRHVHYTRVPDLERPDHIVIAPSVPISGYRDGFENWCSRILAPAGAMRISTDTVIAAAIHGFSGAAGLATPDGCVAQSEHIRARNYCVTDGALVLNSFRETLRRIADGVR
jgi:hypothetical protein